MVHLSIYLYVFVLVGSLIGIIFVNIVILIAFLFCYIVILNFKDICCKYVFEIECDQL